MTRLDFGGAAAPPRPRDRDDAREDLDHLAAGFEIHFTAPALRQLLDDAEHLTGPAGQEVRDAIAAALAVAEMPPPPPRQLPGVPVPEGTRFAVYDSPDATTPIAEVVSGPDGLVAVGPGLPTVDVFIIPIDGDGQP